jgi:hypothetical protein
MKIAAFACAIALVLASQAAAQSANIVGTWIVNVTLDSGPVPPATLTLKNDGGKFAGVFSGQQGDMPVEASVEQKAVTIWFTVPTQNGPVAVTMKGSAEGDAMKGSADLGGHGQATWTATRAAAASGRSGQTGASAEVTGTWAMTVESGAGSGTPTFVLKQDGEKLTGRYSGQLGEADVTGTVKGSAVEMAYDVTVQGTAVHITWAGTVDGASMKGTVKLGEFGEGTFTGKKK